jgi:soluble lytic murein transglycosylase
MALMDRTALAPLALAALLAWSGPVAARDGAEAPAGSAAAKTAAKTTATTTAKTTAKPAAAPAVQLAAKRQAKSKSTAKPQAKGNPEAKAKPASKAETKGKAKPAEKPKAAAAKSAPAAIPLPVTRPTAGTARLASPAAPLALPAAPASPPPAAETPASPPSQAQSIPAPATTIVTASQLDVAAVRRAIEMVRNRKQSQANDIRQTIADPVAKKLVEWVVLRSDDAGATFARFAAFIAANPAWPSIVTLRRKAEAMAFQERPDPATVRNYFSQWPPLSARGKLALARALIMQGERDKGVDLVRETWRYDSLSQDVESRVLDAFDDALTSADHKARMDRRLYEKDDIDAGVRAANRLGGAEPAIAKARIAMHGGGVNKAILDAVPATARNDIGYKLARLQFLRRSEQTAEAAALMLTIPKLDESHDLDEWWIERRLLARKLLDVGDPKNAYLVCRDATLPTNPNYRAEHHFMAGWIALRYLNDAATAYEHFKHIARSNDNPISLARGAYWLGRAAEALDRPREARAHYQEASRHPTAYYGQIARAKAGLGEFVLNPFPALSNEDRTRLGRHDVVRAAELLYATDARDMAWTMMADLGDKSTDVGLLAMLAELTAKYRDARGMLLVGKLALARGYALDHAAFPTIGVPDYQPIGPAVEPAIVYSIVRQESWFNPKTVSSANALGLMQVTPPAGRYVTKKFNATFDQKRLLNDMVYNVQIGSAELGDLIKDYRGSYIMTFAAYNAGRGRVREWVGRYGDPRDPNVDPIDWVERIPFSETRNYVQRVMENVQVYRVRFGGTSRLLIEADLRRGASAN